MRKWFFVPFVITVIAGIILLWLASSVHTPRWPWPALVPVNNLSAPLVADR